MRNRPSNWPDHQVPRSFKHDIFVCGLQLALPYAAHVPIVLLLCIAPFENVAGDQ